jgi:two-component system NtrC family sensor kinase
MKIAIRHPKKSLRTILMLVMLLFAVAPLAFITGYSLVKYEQAIDRELEQRLFGNHREIEVILQEFQKDLGAKNLAHASDKSLMYHLSVNAIPAARELAMKWMKSQFTHHLSVFNREGRLEVALYRNAEGGVSRQENLEGGDVYLSDKFIADLGDKKQVAIVDYTTDGALDLIMFSKIEADSGKRVGYIEEILRIDQNFISGLKNRLSLEMLFYSRDGEKAVASHDDLRQYRHGFFVEKGDETKGRLFELNIRDIPFGFMIKPIKWGENTFYLAIGASKKAALDVLKNVNYAFFSVTGAIILLLVVLSFIFSKIMLQPLNSLVELVQNVDFDVPPKPISHNSENELGILTESFNEMVLRVHEAQSNLKDNIKKLEAANTEIRDTQAKLVHTAKMASLGQLVAGVAHELNNPISFIFSNMAPLRDYAQRLVHLVRAAETDIKSLPAEKEKAEFDYIVTDMPKLIKSCEDGAKRTRDIVLSLRSFSRLEEAKLKEVDVHEGIDSTLALLASEFKSRIKVHLDYKGPRKVVCYPSELNQVFMNILSNAAQAISGQGDIFISTRAVAGRHIEISIRDTGSGMTEETQEKLFDPFFTTKDLKGGTGLGMSISYGIIKKHNGDIQVKSNLGGGSEFIITLPVQLDS